MAILPPKVTYKHSHDCPVKGKFVTNTSPFMGDEYYPMIPHCIHIGVQLEIVENPPEEEDADD